MSGDANGSEMDHTGGRQMMPHIFPPITLAAALQSAHSVVLAASPTSERPSRFEQTGARRGSSDPTPARLDAIARRRVGGHLTGDAARRVGQTTWAAGAGRSVDILVVPSLDDEAVYRPIVGQRRRTRPPPPSPRERLTGPPFLGSILGCH